MMARTTSVRNGSPTVITSSHQRGNPEIAPTTSHARPKVTTAMIHRSDPSTRVRRRDVRANRRGFWVIRSASWLVGSSMRLGYPSARSRTHCGSARAGAVAHEAAGGRAGGLAVDDRELAAHDGGVEAVGLL